MAKRRNKQFASKELIEEFNEYARKIQQDLRELEQYDPDAKSLERYHGPAGDDFFPIDPNVKWNAPTVRKMLSAAKRLYESGELSWDSSERAKATALKTLREDYGYDFIDGRNFSAFMHFLDDARARGLASFYDSDQLIEAYQDMRKKGLSRKQIIENVNRWANKVVKYDKEGKLIERETVPELKTVRTRVEYGLKDAIKERHSRTKRIKRR